MVECQANTHRLIFHLYDNNDNQLEIEINYIPSSDKNYKFNNKGIVLIKMYMKFIETYISCTKQVKS